MSLLDNLTAYWSLDEQGTGFLTAVDASGNGRDLTDDYGSWTTTVGKGDHCRHFNQSVNNATLKRDSGSTLWGYGANDFTMAGWMRPTVITGSGASYFYVASRKDSPNGWKLTIDTSGLLSFNTPTAGFNSS